MILDFDAWIGWMQSLDVAWLFLLILPLVVVVVALWSRSLKSDRERETTQQK